VKGMRWANGANTAASTASVLVRVCIASAKRLAALGVDHHTGQSSVIQSEGEVILAGSL